METRKTAPKTTKKTAKVTKESAWRTLSDDALQALASKINESACSDRISKLILRVNGNQWGQRHAVAWHLVACRAIHPEVHPTILDFLKDDFESPAPEVLVDVLVRFPDVPPQHYFRYTVLLMDGYSVTMDRLLSTAYRRAPDLVMSRKSELNASLRRGLAFVRRCLGETITPEESADILRQLAHYQTKGEGLVGKHERAIHEMSIMEDGVLVKLRLADLAAVKKLAALFGTEKEWDKLFFTCALEGNWDCPLGVRDAFLLATTSQLAQLANLAHTYASEPKYVLAQVIPLRNDDPNALLEAALTVNDDCMRDMLLMGAVYCAGKSAQSIPDKLDELMTFDSLRCVYGETLSTCIEWLKYYPRDRALKLARKLIADENLYPRGVAILAAHFDEEMLKVALERDIGKNLIGPTTLGQLGVPALPLLVWAYDRESQRTRYLRYRAILHAMGKAGESGTFDTKWDRYIDFDSEDGRPIQYYSLYGFEDREYALRGIPEPRRSAILLDRLETTRHPLRILEVAHLAEDPNVVETAIKRIIASRKLEPRFRSVMERLGERALDALCNNIGLSQGDGWFIDALKIRLSPEMVQRIQQALEKAGMIVESPKDALIRMANSATGPKKRIYVLHVDREGYPPTPGTLARSGGKAPGILDKDIPRDKFDEPLTHLFTLDLDEIPELQEKYSGARALAVFCPEPDMGDRAEELKLVPVSREAVEGLSNGGLDSNTEENEEESAESGRPIAIVPVDVPLCVFRRYRRERDDIEREIEKMIFNAAGHVLGEPVWLGFERGEGFNFQMDDFIMQINESLCDISLGDCGSLYVFGEGIWGEGYYGSPRSQL